VVGLDIEKTAYFEDFESDGVRGFSVVRREDHAREELFPAGQADLDVGVADVEEKGELGIHSVRVSTRAKDE
jgi:hypothetical protein